MLFRRRHRLTVFHRLRAGLWPTRTWARSTRYVMFRIWRLRATPYAIAAGCAAGVFVSFTPFMGLHFILAATIAWILRGSLIASAFGTFVGNPLTFPFIWFAAYEFGNWILGERSKNLHIDLSDGIFTSSFEKLWPLIKPMTVGGVPLGLVAALISYYIVRRAVEAYQEKKRRRDGLEPDGGQQARA